ncbi:MAG: hypothetical protein EA391_14520 [Balneolaceae bacterium]|nr:MAG: hypothetical protein EA391_14520 [Balneolaceae bacterium]
MEQRDSDQKKFRLKLPVISTAVMVVLGISFYLELLGMRIVQPQISLAEAWSFNFFSGAMRTAAGAAIVGVLFILAGLLPRRLRPSMKEHAIYGWSFGAALFLLVIWVLILWAP